MKVKFKYSNGQKVKDTVSGLNGIIDQSSIMDTGNVQYSILPQSKDGQKREESWFVDEDSIQIEEGKISRSKEHEFKFETGIKVKDKITQFEGYITRAMLDHNNCVRYTVTGKYNYEKGSPNVHFADEKYLEPVDAPKLETKRTTTGCTSSKSTIKSH